MSIGTAIDQNSYVAVFDFGSGELDNSNQFVPSTDRLFDGNPEAYIEYFSTSSSEVEVSLYHIDAGSYEFILRYGTQFYENEGFEDEAGDPGFLFRAPPVQLTGNIYNTQSKKATLGNFGVVARSTKSKRF